MKKILSVAVASAFVASYASAAITITWYKSDSVITGVITGSISSTELSYATSQTPNPVTVDQHSFDTSTSVNNRNGNCDMYYFSTVSLVQAGQEVKMNDYSGNTGAGDSFGYFMSGATMLLSLPSGYVMGTEISGALTVNDVVPSYELTDYFVFGDAFTLAGNPFVTFVNGAAIPEPSSTLLVASAGLVMCLRRRSR